MKPGGPCAPLRPFVAVMKPKKKAVYELLGSYMTSIVGWPGETVISAA